MPDTRLHRGAHPQDAALFAPSAWPVLRQAAGELYWLLDRGYALRSALVLVGDRHALAARQRLALARAACSQAQQQQRRQHERAPAALAGSALWIDGYNILITMEAALGGGILLRARDGCLRDMASLHGTYRHVQETGPALRLLGSALAGWAVPRVIWVLDRPVANSGRLRGYMLQLAAREGWDWHVELEASADGFLARVDGTITTSDSAVLDRANRWVNLLTPLVAAQEPQPTVIDLSEAG